MLSINIYMIAPDNKPTEKTEQRIAQERKSYPDNTPSTQPNSNTHYIDMDMQSLMRGLLNSQEMRTEIRKEALRRIDSEEAASIVKNFLSEYFTSCIVLGYDVEGNRTVIRNSNSDRDDDSLIELIRFVLLNMVDPQS